MKKAAEDFKTGIGVVDKFVEFINATEGVLVCCIAVEKLVLDETVKRAEFWEIAS